MTANEFKKKLKVLGLSTGRAANALHVSRYAVMHWKAGRRPVPGVVTVALDALELKRQKEFLE